MQRNYLGAGMIAALIVAGVYLTVRGVMDGKPQPEIPPAIHVDLTPMPRTYCLDWREGPIQTQINQLQEMYWNLPLAPLNQDEGCRKQVTTITYTPTCTLVVFTPVSASLGTEYP